MEIFLGILFGLVLGIANSKILSLTIHRALDTNKDKKKKVRIILISYGLRYIVLIIMFIVLLKLGYIKAFIASLIALTVTSVLYTIISQNNKIKKEGSI